MPGPGKRNKKPKPSVNAARSLTPSASNAMATIASEFVALSMTLTDSDARDVDGVAAGEDWTGAVYRICDFCHFAGPQYEKGLEESLQQFRYLLQAPRGHLHPVWRISEDTDWDRFLKKLMPLLRESACQRVTLQALQTITRHAGVLVRLEISKHATELIRILENNPSDSTAELVISVLSHTLCTAFDGKVESDEYKPAYPDLLKTLDVTRIIRATVQAALKPSASSSIIHHTIELLYAASMHAARAFKTYPDATKILIAGLSSKDWERRCASLQALICLHTLESVEDREHFDPRKYVLALRNLPNHISRALDDYGAPSCDTVVTTMCTVDFQTAINRAAEDLDFHALGLVIARNILRTEFPIVEGSFQYQDDRGKWVVMDHLPFKMWSDSLPLCSKALRATKVPEKMDMADIIDIKYRIIKQRQRDAMAIGLKALERNPHQGYWYYAISMDGDPVKGLKAAKQGLKCSQLTPHVKHQLLYRAIDYAGELGIEILRQMPNAGTDKWYEGIALLHSAFEDAKTYILEAPPDNRNMKNVLYWYLLLIITIKDLDPDLHEIEDAKKKLEINEEIMRIVGFATPSTKMRLTQQTVVKHYKESVERFGDIIKRAGSAFHDCSHDLADPTSEENEDKMAAWLGNLDLEDRTLNTEEVYQVGAESRISKSGVEVAVVDGEYLSLYQCGWCGNPSASLRKCSGCGNARYCDIQCQKQAWSTHKKACTKEASIPESSDKSTSSKQRAAATPAAWTSCVSLEALD
ncbi:hypothetical protein NP233_g7053 [Leucocoprinus birnbaumii]|uniref:MYND-type domain-containing protein n=1 Tax=Leucocoprinus birnbaumii TaxID=56174 RepID=A0AAD5VPY0_9AGAR|nr:hypothetical protein NP233_g7053 [Leucocoprinus birnbaumii]